MTDTEMEDRNKGKRMTNKSRTYQCAAPLPVTLALI